MEQPSRSGLAAERRLRPLRRPRPRFAHRSDRGLSGSWPHSSPPGNGFVSSMFSPLPSTIRRKRFAAEFIRGNNERPIRLRLPDVDHAQIAATLCLAGGHPGAVSSGSVLSRILQGLLHFFLIDIVIPDMRLTGCRVQVEAKVHSHQYRWRLPTAQTGVIAPVDLTYAASAPAAQNVPAASCKRWLSDAHRYHSVKRRLINLAIRPVPDRLQSSVTSHGIAGCKLDIVRFLHRHLRVRLTTRALKRGRVLAVAGSAELDRTTIVNPRTHRAHGYTAPRLSCTRGQVHESPRRHSAAA